MTALERLLQKLGRKSNDRPAVIAHRGASLVAPENTITAFEIAVEQGADAVELDVRLTSDKDLVVMHDAWLGRTTTRSRPVSAMTADEVTSLDAGVWFGKAFRGELVPLLEEALTTLKGRAVPLVEIKDSGQPGVAAAERLVAVIEEAGMAKDVIVTSYYDEPLEIVGRLSPGTVRAGVAKRHVGAVAALAAYDGCLVWRRVFDRDLVAAMRRSGAFVAPWVVPESKVLWFAAAGVDAIVTDDPAGALKRLGES